MADRIETLKTFLEKNPKDCFLNHALALELIKQGDDQDAKALFEKNLTHDPNYLATYYHLGKLLERAEKTDYALHIYEQGMKIAKAQNEQHTYNELQSVHDALAY